MAEPLRPPTDDERAAYKAAFRASCLAGRATIAVRQSWLPDHPELPEAAQTGSQYMANLAIHQALIDEVCAELDAEKAAHG